jgi:hypothetical protein
MNNINKIIKDIENINSNELLKKVNLITSLNNLIDKEKTIYNNYLEDLNNKEIAVLHKEYKNYNIDELQLMFENDSNINNMIKIYQTLSYKIDKIINELFTEELTDIYD